MGERRLMETRHFIVIKTKSSIYISDNVKGESYFASKIPQYVFDDGAIGEKTFKQYWFKIPAIPTNIYLKLPDTRVFVKWTLKAGYPATQLTPNEILADSFIDSNIAALYEKQYDVIEGQWEQVAFDLEIIDEMENFYVDAPKYSYTNSIIDQIEVRPDFLSEKPCSITSENLYNVVRKHVKLNIDPKYAHVSSDYDFCFCVQKNIALHTPESYTIDVGTKRKPVHAVRYKTDRKVTLLNIAPKPYQACSILQPIHGKNYLDLESKIDRYLTDLMEEINKPLKECPTCKGHGVINIDA